MSSISVVVPVYNTEKYLDKCIKSILNQTFTDFELILVNDGSSDNSINILKKYRNMDSRVIIIDKNNGGSIKARRDGIKKSKSEYITFVDSDDWLEKNALEISYNELKKSNSDVAVFNMYKVIDKLGLIKKENNRYYFDKKNLYVGDEVRKEIASAYLHGHPFPAGLCGKVYKTKYIRECGKYLERINFLGDDLYYNLEIFLKVKKVSMINIPLYYYRAGGNTSKYMQYLFDDMVNGYKIQKEVIEEYYQDSIKKRYNGISIMLINTLKTCLYNIFYSDLGDVKIKETIKEYTKNNEILEAIKNDSVKRYFDNEFLRAIEKGDELYLFNIGQKMYKKSKVRSNAIKILSLIG